MKQKQTTVMIVLLAIAMITVPIASAGVTAFNVAPTTTTCDTNSSYMVQVNTTGFESLNITIPAGYTAVVPEGVYTVNITWINTTTGLGGQNNTEMITLSGGGTYVSGFISTNTTWTLTGSPYIVIGDVIVEEGVELTINPDVIVKFDSGKSLIIDGILNARGNAANKIVFTSNATTPASGDWGTIKFRDPSVDSACIIDWAIVEYGSTGITCEDSSQIGSPRIENTVIKHNNIGVKITTTHPPHIAGLLIKNSAISNNSGNAVYIDAGVVNITGTTIQDNDGWGVKTSGAINAIYIIDSAIQNCSAGGVYGECITLTGCTIAENGGNGVSGWVDVIISKSIIKNNIGHGVHHRGSHGLINIIQILIQNNTGTGIDCGSATQVFIEYSVITDNGQSGISNDGGAVHYNNIHNNTIYNFKNGGSSDVNATQNWWGTTNTTRIAQHIYDYYDDYNLGKVTYVPFLTEPVTPGNKPPNASFTFSPSHPVTGQIVSFDASGSYDPDGGNITEYWWNISGTVYTVPAFNHTFTTPGLKYCGLIVTDDDGDTNGSAKWVNVNATTAPPPPVLTSIEVSPQTATLNITETQQFTTTAKDQYGNTMPGIIFTWSSSNTATGVINQNGLFTANAPGTTTVKATNSSINGTASVIVIFKADYTLFLATGWNFVSIPKKLAAGNNTVEAVFGDVNRSSHSIFLYNTSTAEWNVMNLTDEVKPLDGIWIYSAESKAIPITFDNDPLRTPPTKILYNGWNAIGLSDTIPTSTNDALSPVEDEWTFLIGFDAINQQYQTTIINNNHDGDERDEGNPMNSGIGYWVYMKEDGELAGLSV